MFSRKWIRITLASCTLLITAVQAHAAALNYSETWNTAGDLAGWGPNTTDATVINPGAGGNPGGYLLSRRSGPFPIGANTELPAATENFATGVWTARFDMQTVEGLTSNAALRFRYQDSTFNGWHYDFANVIPGAWTTYAIAFDTGWTDLQALAAGWVQEATSPSWATTMSDVYTTELRVDGTSTLLIGIDNFSLVGPASVPIPGTLALFALGLVAVSARRKTLAPRTK